MHHLMIDFYVTFLFHKIDSAPVSPMSVAKTPVETPATVDSLDLGSPEGNFKFRCHFI